LALLAKANKREAVRFGTFMEIKLGYFPIAEKVLAIPATMKAETTEESFIV
jgi:hypothetical protein